jgi:hypothetical protein
VTRITDEAVEAAEREYEAFGGTMRDALEAVLPHLEPQPVVDREELVALQKAHRYVADSALGEPGCICGLEFPGGFDYIEHAEHVADVVLALLNGSAK